MEPLLRPIPLQFNPTASAYEVACSLPTALHADNPVTYASGVSVTAPQDMSSLATASVVDIENLNATDALKRVPPPPHLQPQIVHPASLADSGIETIASSPEQRQISREQSRSNSFSVNSLLLRNNGNQNGRPQNEGRASNHGEPNYNLAVPSETTFRGYGNGNKPVIDVPRMISQRSSFPCHCLLSGGKWAEALFLSLNWLILTFNSRFRFFRYLE